LVKPFLEYGDLAIFQNVGRRHVGFLNFRINDYVKWGPTDPAAPTERGTVHLCCFAIFLLSVCAYSASAVVVYCLFAISLVAPEIASLDRYGRFDVKCRSLMLFPVLPKPEVVFNGQTVADSFIVVLK